jgi:hypothetical protein
LPVDGAILEKSEIAATVEPMRMVLQRRLPGKLYHVRIAVYRAGLPLSIFADNSVAGFRVSRGPWTSTTKLFPAR